MKLYRMQALAWLVFLISAASLYAQEAAIGNMADDLVRSLPAEKPPLRVAVVDFTDLNSNVTNLGRYFAQELETALVTSHARITLVNRTRLKQLLIENKLGATGIIDPETAQKLGKIAGVQALITGTITPFDKTVRLDVEAIDAEDARVLAAVSKTILKTREIGMLLPVQTTPAIVAGGPAVTPTAAPPQRKVTPPQVFESHDIRFTLNSCEHSSTSIICKLTITNMSDDRNLSIHNHCNSPSRIIDNIGREFHPNEVLLGSTRDEQCWAEATLVNQVPTRMEIRFNNVPSDVSGISLFELPSVTNNQNIDVTYHRVPLTQQRY